MGRIIKWIGIVVGVLLGLILVAALGLSLYAQILFKRTYVDRPLQPITADTSPEGLARGEYLMENVMNCTEACHTDTDAAAPLAGEVEYINDGLVSFVFAPPNITMDVSTGIGAWSDAEIARAIREGIDKDGVGLVIMPSYNYRVLSDSDAAAIAGYLRSVEPVNNEVPSVDGNIVAKILLVLGLFGQNPVGEPITSQQNTPKPETVEYGEYLVKLGACSDCHGTDLAGGPMPFAEPGDAIPANLTPAGKLSGWTEGEFIAAVYSGFGEGGRKLDEGMPHYEMEQEDLIAVFNYLKTIPPVQSQ